MNLEEFFNNEFEIVENFMVAIDKITDDITDCIYTDDVVTLMARIKGVDS